MNEDDRNVYRAETSSANSLDIEVQKADVALRASEADDLVASLKPGRRERGQPVGLDVHQEGDTIFIRSIDNQTLSRQKLTVEVPTAIRTIRAQLSRGDLRVSGLAEVDLNLGVDKGDVRLTELSGRIHLKTGHGDIKARTLAGWIELSAGSGDVKITEASGDWIKLNTGHGDIVIERVTGNTLCTLGHGDIVTKNLGGELEITSGAGDVVLSTQDALKAHVSIGAGDILVHKGSLRELTASTKRGDIKLQAELLQGQFDLSSKSGDVRVVLQPDANVRFEAATARGDLVSDIPGVKVGRPGPASRSGGRLVGVIGDGRAELSLHTSRGDVRIRFPRGYKGEMGAMGADALDEMKRDWQMEAEAIRIDKESLRAAMDAARDAMLTTKEPLREALTATRDVVETSLQHGTASVLRATEEALQITTSALRSVEEALQDIDPRSVGNNEDAAGPMTSPMSSAPDGGTGTGSEGVEQPQSAAKGSPSSMDDESDVGALEDSLQAAKGTIMSALNQVKESATQAWAEVLQAIEIKPHEQEEQDTDREQGCSPPRPDAEKVVARETAGESAVSEAQAAPAEEATALRVLEALQASEIDVDEAERLLAQL